MRREEGALAGAAGWVERVGRLQMQRLESSERERERERENEKENGRENERERGSRERNTQDETYCGALPERTQISYVRPGIMMSKCPFSVPALHSSTVERSMTPRISISVTLTYIMRGCEVRMSWRRFVRASIPPPLFRTTELRMTRSFGSKKRSHGLQIRARKRKRAQKQKQKQEE